MRERGDPEYFGPERSAVLGDAGYPLLAGFCMDADDFDSSLRSNGQQPNGLVVR